MKKVSLIFILLIGLGSISYAQTVTIGKQVWMTKNLDVATFRNGDSIPQVKTDEEWEKAGLYGQPAWCYYDNDTANGAKYGKLYNWYAVTDSRGLAPVGYHIPTSAEWTKLTDFLGGESVAGTKMKSKSGWNDYRGKSGNGTNSSGFNGLPGGFRSYSGSFYEIGYYGYWCWFSEYYWDGGWYRYLSFFKGSVVSNHRDLHDQTKESSEGFSVRCLRD
jgi:uncharacterized protein (TIGR02145 family)